MKMLIYLLFATISWFITDNFAEVIIFIEHFN